MKSRSRDDLAAKGLKFADSSPVVSRSLKGAGVNMGETNEARDDGKEERKGKRGLIDRESKSWIILVEKSAEVVFL